MARAKTGAKFEPLKTVKEIENAKAPGLYPIVGQPNLYLQVREKIGKSAKRGELSKSWIFRYMLAGVTVTKNGKTRPVGTPTSREMGLGPVRTRPLAAACLKAQECRQLLLDGIDPIKHRDDTRLGRVSDAAKAKTFEHCGRAYVKAHRASWRNAKHAAQWESTLEAYAYPKIGKLPVGAIETAHVVDVLEPIWTTKRETAARLRGRIESVLNMATALTYREGPNPARWRGHLDQILSKRIKAADREHHAALAFKEVPAFIRALRDQDGVAARALEFLILTAARTSEVIGMTWAELDAKSWTIPGERMKGGRPHQVPLPPTAAQIIEEMRDLGAGDFVFPGARGAGLSNMAMLKTLERMGRSDLTVHGFRSSFRDWAAELTSFPNHVVEMALAHAIGNKVEAAYRRGELFEKRSKLMDAWAAFCSRPAKEASVTPIRAAKHL